MAARQWLTEAVEDIRASYWFLPTLLAIAGLALGLVMVLIDALVGEDWLGRYSWFYGSRPQGARAMLSTIAGSTITVAGVVFSITLAAVTYASGQFGPRLLGNFMRDRGNQATLGIFIGTYLYCLVVLRTIRSAGEADAGGSGVLREAFVPHLAMFGGLALAIASTAMLIYFVHHVTSGIHINNVVAGVGRSLIADVRKQKVGDPDAPNAPPALNPRPSKLLATSSGYIEAIDFDALLTLARRDDLVLRPVRRAGDFVAEGWPLIEIHALEPVPHKLSDALVDGFRIGRQRTDEQDLRFAIDELVEVAARALSPGVNDPFTAIACMDWLGAALAEIDRSPAPLDRIRDEDGTVRILLRPLGFEDYLASAFGQLRSYVAADPNARARALATLTELATNAEDPSHRALVEAERRRLAAVIVDED